MGLTPKGARKGPNARSGPTMTKEARRDAGLVRLDMWLPAELVEQLDRTRGKLSRREAVEAALRSFLET